MKDFKEEINEALDEEDYQKVFYDITQLYNSVCNNIASKDFEEREESIERLSRKFIEVNDRKDSNLNKVRNLSFLIELSNGMAHIVEKKLKSDSRLDKSKIIKIKNKLFNVKNQSLMKCIQISKNTKEVIIGRTRDDEKEFNKDVVVIDLPGYGQLSWHTTLNKFDSKEMKELPEYKFEIDKSGGDTSKNLNSKILCGRYDASEMNTHNRLVKYVTEGRENELNRLLSVYEFISRKSGELTKERDKLDLSCEMYGLLSEDNFNVLVDQYYEYEVSNDKEYKQEIREWRYEYPEEMEDGDPIEEEENER